MGAEVVTAKRARRKAPAAALPPLPESPNPVDIAMAAAAAGKPLPEVARRLLEQQADLIHAQCTELKVRAVGERVRAALWAVLALAALGIIGLLVSLVVHASRSDALIVESFRVPPAMTNQGLSGEVVASQVLDRLAGMQAQTESTRAASSYDNNWGDELKIDIPNTGATADQVWKLLRGALGKETRISGEVTQTNAGMALTARVGGTPGQRFVSTAGDLDQLVTQAAELIFRETQPYRYSIYLQREQSANDASKQVLEQLSRDPSERERKWAYSGLSVIARSQGEFARAIAFAKQALAIDPVMIPAMANLGNAEQLLGHDQAMVDTYTRTMTLPVGRDYDGHIIASNFCRIRANIAAVVRDPRELDAAANCADAIGALAAQVPAFRRTTALLRHDPAAAAAVPVDAAAGAASAELAAWQVSNRLLIELERGRSPALAAALAGFEPAMQAAAAQSGQTGYGRATALRDDWAVETEALVALGRLPEAAALIARTPLDCYTCVRDRGLVAEAAGNARDAQRWYAEAVRQGPRLAPAYADWGRLLGKVRHFATADAKLQQAIALAPNWADPHKLRGDILAVQGQHAAAAAEYRTALRLAPRWAGAQAALAALPKA